MSIMSANEFASYCVVTHRPYEVWYGYWCRSHKVYIWNEDVGLFTECIPVFFGIAPFTDHRLFTTVVHPDAQYALERLSVEQRWQ